MDRFTGFMRNHRASIMTALFVLLSISFAIYQTVGVPGSMTTACLGLWLGFVFMLPYVREDAMTDRVRMGKDVRSRAILFSIITIVLSCIIAPTGSSIVIVDGKTTLSRSFLLAIPFHDEVKVIPATYGVSVVSMGDTLFGGGPLKASLVTTEVAFTPDEHQLFDLLRRHPDLKQYLELKSAFAAINANRQWQANKPEASLTSFASAEVNVPTNILPIHMKWGKPLKVQWN